MSVYICLYILFFILGGYPEVPGSSPSHPGGLSKNDCLVISGFTEALCFAFRSDNNGPPMNISVSLISILNIYNTINNNKVG